MHQTEEMRDNLSDYFLRVTGARSIRAIALAAGLEPSTLGRQLVGSMTAESLVAVCRAFDLDLADAFVAAELITDEEANRLGARVGLAAYTDLELAREIVRRIEEGTAGDSLTGDLPDVPNVLTSVEDLDLREPRDSFRLAADKGDLDADQPHAD